MSCCLALNKIYGNWFTNSLSVGGLWIRFEVGKTKYVDRSVEDFRTGVRFPPPPPQTMRSFLIKIWLRVLLITYWSSLLALYLKLYPRYQQHPSNFLNFGRYNNQIRINAYKLIKYLNSNFYLSLVLFHFSSCVNRYLMTFNHLF